ncbi:hypothetical protein Q3A66_16410 [Hymenobacter sp. BT770]|uniref:hypothetical protein n=1 Tax=Hymenobacter sp. BT770 TaxID=2886942 RepID=UPI001D11913A|nr:hypothetical protein [Hymenobacter sp. BT770]MCC3154599.1 hypothetical protein [Hymenobacter sp. BT770]MDO3416653.1 hypothetical protein [Hymenobacter sp. BT770]
MTPVQFPVHQNFLLNPQAWGKAEHRDVVNLLDNVISIFYSNLNKGIINERPVLVVHSSLHNPPRDYPELITFNETSFIFLITQDTSWSQYAYQFAHELCHYVINIPFPPKCDKFGWLEEAICELASIYTLKKMASDWRINPPYPNWVVYSDSLNSYADNIIHAEENILDIPFNQWLTSIMDTLYQNRVDRKSNRIVALQLLPVFIEQPILWQAVQYLSNVEVTIHMSFDSFISEWEAFLPADLQAGFSRIQEALFQSTSS